MIRVRHRGVTQRKSERGSKVWGHEFVQGTRTNLGKMIGLAVPETRPKEAISAGMHERSNCLPLR